MYSSLEECVNSLLNGGLAVLPSETVYGLAAVATDSNAVCKIYKLKGRPPSNPLIVHVLDLDMAKKVVHLSSLAEKIISCFWPGPLTLVLNKKKIVPSIVTAGLETVAIRAPSHPLFRKVLRKVNAPLAAPSANPSNAVSPTTANHVFHAFGDSCPPTLDGGLCDYGLESTVLDLSTHIPKILRPGPISNALIKKRIKIELAESTFTGQNSGKPSKSPGSSSRHYSPKTPLHIYENIDELKKVKLNELTDLVLCIDKKNANFFEKKRIETLCFSEDGDPRDIAQNFYLTLQNEDKIGKKRIIAHLIEKDIEIANAVNDRLKRASSN